MKDVTLARSEKKEGGTGEGTQNPSTIITNEDTHIMKHETSPAPLSPSIPSPLPSPVHFSLQSQLKREMDKVTLPEDYKQLPTTDLLLLTEKLIDFYQNINSIVKAQMKLEEEELSEYADISSTTDDEFSCDSTTTDDNSNSYDRTSEISEDLDLLKNSNPSFHDLSKHDPPSHSHSTIPDNTHSNSLHSESIPLEENLDSLPRKQASDEPLYNEECIANHEVTISVASGSGDGNRKIGNAVLSPGSKPSPSPPPVPPRSRHSPTEQITIPVSNAQVNSVTTTRGHGSSGNMFQTISNVNAEAILSSPPRCIFILLFEFYFLNGMNFDLILFLNSED